MRAWLVAALLLLPATALSAEVGETLFTKGRTPSTRFVDAKDEGPTFAPASKVIVIYVEGDRMRVMGPDDTFGWIEATAAVGLTELSQDLQQEAIQALMGGAGAGGGSPFSGMGN